MVMVGSHKVKQFQSSFSRQCCLLPLLLGYSLYLRTGLFLFGLSARWNIILGSHASKHDLRAMPTGQPFRPRSLSLSRRVPLPPIANVPLVSDRSGRSKSEEQVERALREPRQSDGALSADRPTCTNGQISSSCPESSDGKLEEAAEPMQLI